MVLTSSTSKVIGPNASAAALKLGGSPLGSLAVPEDPGGPTELQAQSGRILLLVFITVFALIWNGGVWASLFTAFYGGFSWPLLFVLPFALVGIGLLAAVAYLIMAMKNPRPRLTVTPGLVRLGQPFEVRWSLDKQTTRLRRLTITLEGLESATFQQGTNSVTHTDAFHETTVSDQAADGFTTVSWDGDATITIPATAMHSFDAPHNKILWRLTVKGVIPRWPDINVSYVLAVAPPNWEPATP